MVKKIILGVGALLLVGCAMINCYSVETNTFVGID